MTKVVYCKDTNRKADYAIIQFDFLGYTRLAKWRGGLFGVSFEVDPENWTGD
jgi:hypothetical protein